MVETVESKAVVLDIGGKKRAFDIDDPKLPGWIDDNAFSSGGYPYPDKLDKEVFAKTLEDLQAELVKVQFWLQKTGGRVMALFEGRDAAGKGGAIHDTLAYMNPRTARVVALTKPTETERGQWYYQRYVSNFPTSGEFVLFDRSWYTPRRRGAGDGLLHARAACAFPQADAALRKADRRGWHPLLQVLAGYRPGNAAEAFSRSRHDRLKVWKLSPMDIAALNKWEDYSEKRDLMLKENRYGPCALDGGARQ